ncbi:MAG: hypothetical protein A7315_14370 [Candidatus Altiarchaeales archaeon WOR_SM1_79]|nr:MAG: hypothetical protein A7315_14370 [Candidatus Altiarchaeales archaeon WOR_SM1_79]
MGLVIGFVIGYTVESVFPQKGEIVSSFGSVLESAITGGIIGAMCGLVIGISDIPRIDKKQPSERLIIIANVGVFPLRSNP